MVQSYRPCKQLRGAAHSGTMFHIVGVCSGVIGHFAAWPDVSVVCVSYDARSGRIVSVGCQGRTCEEGNPFRATCL